MKKSLSLRKHQNFERNGKGKKITDRSAKFCSDYKK